MASNHTKKCSRPRPLGNRNQNHNEMSLPTHWDKRQAITSVAKGGEMEPSCVASFVAAGDVNGAAELEHSLAFL